MLGFGIFILVNPEITLKVLTRLLGILSLAGGIFLFISHYSQKNHSGEVIPFMALLYAGIGIVFTFFPGLIAGAFVLILGIFAILVGLFNLWLLFKTKEPLTGMAIIRNVLIILLGLFLLARPLRGQAAIGIVLGIFALLFGVASLYTAYRLRILKKTG